jgi:hypothetical protein
MTAMKRARRRNDVRCIGLYRAFPCPGLRFVRERKEAQIVALPELNIVTEYGSTVATRRQMRPAFKQKTAAARAAFESYVES